MIKSLAINQRSCKNLNIVEFIEYTKSFNGVEFNIKSIQKYLSENNILKDIIELLEVYNTKLISIFRLKDFSLNSEKE